MKLKKFVSLLLAVTVLVGLLSGITVTAAAAGRDAVVNGGFENGDAGWKNAAIATDDVNVSADGCELFGKVDAIVYQVIEVDPAYPVVISAETTNTTNDVEIKVLEVSSADAAPTEADFADAVSLTGTTKDGVCTATYEEPQGKYLAVAFCGSEGAVIDNVCAYQPINALIRNPGFDGTQNWANINQSETDPSCWWQNVEVGDASNFGLDGNDKVCEINADQPGIVYQIIDVVPGKELKISVDYTARADTPPGWDWSFSEIAQKMEIWVLENPYQNVLFEKAEKLSSEPVAATTKWVTVSNDVAYVVPDNVYEVAVAFCTVEPSYLWGGIGNIIDNACAYQIVNTLFENPGFDGWTGFVPGWGNAALCYDDVEVQDASVYAADGDGNVCEINSKTTGVVYQIVELTPGCDLKISVDYMKRLDVLSGLVELDWADVEQSMCIRALPVSDPAERLSIDDFNNADVLGEVLVAGENRQTAVVTYEPAFGERYVAIAFCSEQPDGTNGMTASGGILIDNVSAKLVYDLNWLPVWGGESCPCEDYTDLDVNAWYHDGVHYCLEENLMEGTGYETFAPDASMTRAMIVTILWRLDGSPMGVEENSFTDVERGSWYSYAVDWAAAFGVVEGYSETAFGPGDAITREQLAAILWRYAKYRGYDVSVGGDTSILSYQDAFDVSEYAYPALQWACGAGLMEGSNESLLPQGTATRAQAATILYRFLSK